MLAANSISTIIGVIRYYLIFWRRSRTIIASTICPWNPRMTSKYDWDVAWSEPDNCGVQDSDDTRAIARNLKKGADDESTYHEEFVTSATFATWFNPYPHAQKQGVGRTPAARRKVAACNYQDVARICPSVLPAKKLRIGLFRVVLLRRTERHYRGFVGTNF